MFALPEIGKSAVSFVQNLTLYSTGASSPQTLFPLSVLHDYLPAVLTSRSPQITQRHFKADIMTTKYQFSQPDLKGWHSRDTHPYSLLTPPI